MRPWVEFGLLAVSVFALLVAANYLTDVAGSDYAKANHFLARPIRAAFPTPAFVSEVRCVLAEPDGLCQWRWD